MTTGAIIWLGIFLLSALLFFGLAAVIAWLGLKDLRELLSHSRKLGREGVRPDDHAGRSDFR
jgi:hypothetical protein